MNRSRELLREPRLGRRGHQVDVRDEDARGDRLLRDAPDEGGLPVPPRREDDDVLPVLHVRGQLRDLGFAIGEGLVEGKGSEAEGIRRVCGADETTIPGRVLLLTL